MNAVFADSFYWVALADPSGPRYQDDLKAESDLVGARIVTTDEVLSEFLRFSRGTPGCVAGRSWLKPPAK